MHCLMFVPCIVRRGRINQQYAVLCTTYLFYIYNIIYIFIYLFYIYILYTTYSICISSNSDGSKKLPDDGRLLPKHAGASV
jgi:hypothetical protein